MWYKSKSNWFFYIDDASLVWKCWDDGAFTRSGLDAEVVANICDRIDAPPFASEVLRGIDTVMHAFA